MLTTIFLDGLNIKHIYNNFIIFVFGDKTTICDILKNKLHYNHSKSNYNIKSNILKINYPMKNKNNIKQ